MRPLAHIYTGNDDDEKTTSGTLEKVTSGEHAFVVSDLNSQYYQKLLLAKRSCAVMVSLLRDRDVFFQKNSCC